MATVVGKNTNKIFESLCTEFKINNEIDGACYFKANDVKRGLRNADGTGVVAGVTQIGDVVGYDYIDGHKIPAEGRLFYRGINIEDLINGFTSENRFGFEETAYLLLVGDLPTKEQLELFKSLISDCYSLPKDFTEDMIFKAPSKDIMNKLGRSILALYSYDDDPDSLNLEHELMEAISLIAKCPVIIANGYAAKHHYIDGGSLHIHVPKKELSIAENFLRLFRSNRKFSDEEAKLLDLCLVLHADHGGGNNSAFTCRVLSSSHTDIYASISAAVGSLKGPRHGGANKKVMEMFGALKNEVTNWNSDDQIRDALNKVAHKEIGDKSGLIYGIGHAIYTLSDPRAVILKRFAKDLAVKKGFAEEFAFYESVERIAPEILAMNGNNKVVCANVDFYSGLIYKMLGIPEELYTPLFATARMVGWCAHRIEEVYNTGNKIIRPAYKAVVSQRDFIPLDKR